MKKTRENNPTLVRQDACILADIWLALWQVEEQHTLDISNLVITIKNRIIRVSGLAANEHECHLVECIVRANSGEYTFFNRLKIKPGNNKNIVS